MKAKLTLDMDDLEVESFETQARRRPALGTVRGNAVEDGVPIGCETAGGCPLSANVWDCTYADCGLDTGWQQCGYSYGGTCGASPPVSVYEACDGMLMAGEDCPIPPVCG